MQFGEKEGPDREISSIFEIQSNNLFCNSLDWQRRFSTIPIIGRFQIGEKLLQDGGLLQNELRNGNFSKKLTDVSGC